MKVRINKPSLYIFINGVLTKKKCPKCKLYLSPKDFQKNSQRGNGLAIYCRRCKHGEYLKKQAHYVNRGKQRTSKFRLIAYEIIANGKELKCAYHNLYNCCGDSKCALYLSLDHINSDGYEHRKELNLKRGNSIVMYRWIIEHPDEARNRLQILCMNAQWMKRRFNAELEGGGKGFIVVSQEEVKT